MRRNAMSRGKTKPTPKPSGEQSLGELGWGQVVKAIRQLAA
jgi:hypothetical protein